MITFPDGFLWGAATSHFQVEGNPSEISTRCSDWAEWTVSDGRIADRTTADEACQFFRRYPDDLELLNELNLNTFRISLNWPALCLDANGSASLISVNREQIEHYRRLLVRLKSQGIKTFVTLFHFCLPKHLADQGGWLNPATPEEFGRLAELAAREYKGLVDYWITINEPLAYTYQGYICGAWPPGLKHSYDDAFLCIHNMLKGHALAYQAIHAADPHARVSYTMHWRPFIARNKFSPADQMVRHLRDAVFNHLFPKSVQSGKLEFPFPFNLKKAVEPLSGLIPGLKDSMDYLAINYYTRDVCEFSYEPPFDLFGVKTVKREIEVNGMGWESYPEGLYTVLTEEIAPYRFDSKGFERPIMITENGYASVFPADMTDGNWSLDDQARISYLQSHLMAIHEAIKHGANVQGYLHWALLDNFEWSEGLRIRFGLVRVAYPTQVRTLRQSAHYYAQIARANGLEGTDTGNGPAR
jgi:beta-glucosidase